MKDKIFLTGMEFFGRHGVLPEEQKLGQRFLVDVELFFSLAHGGRTDDLGETVNYAEVYQLVKQLVEGRPYKLLEALAEAIAGQILGDFAMVEEVKVTVHKPQAPIPGIFADVGCEIWRGRS